MIKALVLPLLLLVLVLGSSAQDKAAVQMDRPDTLKAGGPIAFTVTLDEPLPRDAHFDFRISPIGIDEEISLGSGEPVDALRKTFRVSGVLPEGALPGNWHISVVWLFLPGTGWTHNTIATNNLAFRVSGKPYPIPKKAEVVVAH